MTHAQSEAGTLTDRLTREKGIENPIQRLASNPASRIGNYKTKLASAGINLDTYEVAKLAGINAVLDKVH